MKLKFQYLQNSKVKITMHSLGLTAAFDGVLLEEYPNLPKFEELPDAWEHVGVTEETIFIKI